MTKKGVNKFIARRAFDHMLFGWVSSYRLNFPTASVLRAVQAFKDYFQLADEDFNIESARNSFERMNSEWVEYKRSG